MMRQELCVVRSVKEVAESIFVLTFTSPFISKTIQPGQFVNLRVGEGTDPLLRRPFSVYRTIGTDIEIIFNIIGRGTVALRMKGPGDLLDVLGPLGTPFSFVGHDFETALLIGGGLGVAPLPITTTALKQVGKTVLTFLGARTGSHLVETHLSNVHVATDDGTKGFHGTVVELAKEFLNSKSVVKPKIFACGPTAMLRAVADLAVNENIPCEVSLEGVMGCGFGICQGCPVELIDGGKKYALMCKDGPTFDVRKVRI